MERNLKRIKMLLANLNIPRTMHLWLFVNHILKYLLAFSLSYG